MGIELQHDGVIDIAVGKYRNTKTWKNEKWALSKIINRLSKEIKTTETHAEYIALPKERQAEIKDQSGGFVGGYLTAGRRKNGSVAHRQLVTLDIDHATDNLWLDFTTLYDCSACCYSTHKHHPKSPRIRLIVPLDREVLADEYVAISRWLAGSLGINNFDPVSFRPAQLMYWQSTPIDVEYFFDYQDGEWLSADYILKQYTDWQDSSSWPMADREQDVVAAGVKKQQDPQDKKGPIGAFCRIFDIHSAIETFLSDTYVACDIDDRYTYVNGSTSAGLVVYEDSFAFSHHGTDPTSGKLCNAFDLVRIHRFGHLDEKSRSPEDKRPSVKAMLDFAKDIPEVKRQIIAEDFEQLDDGDFDETQPVEEVDDSWKADLDTDTKGHPLSNAKNVLLILTNDPKYKGRFAFNEFEKREVAVKDLPWRKIDRWSTWLNDDDSCFIRNNLSIEYGIRGKELIEDGITICTRKNSINPLKDYLNSVKWDGIPRLETLLIDYLGAADNEYTRAVIRITLVAAVWRVLTPGIKFEQVLVLTGDQGKGKSTLIRKLGMQWFTDNFSMKMIEKGKESIEQIQGFWIIEIGEMAGIHLAEVNSVKNFLSREWDNARMAYAKRNTTMPRVCIFFGTSNKPNFLRDISGNRRYWPVEIGVIEPKYPLQGDKEPLPDLTQEIINQIWAEAFHLKDSTPLVLSPALRLTALAVQQAHTEADPLRDLIEKFLDTKLPEAWPEMTISERQAYYRQEDQAEDDFMMGEAKTVGKVERDRVCAVEIWTELMRNDRFEINRFKSGPIYDILDNMPGWKPYKSKTIFKLYGTQKGYYREQNTAAIDFSGSKFSESFDKAARPSKN